MNHEAVLTFEYATPARARRVERSLIPEVGDIDDERSQTRLRRNGETLELVVEAADLVALRAGMNTWLSLVTVAERAGDVFSPAG